MFWHRIVSSIAIDHGRVHMQHRILSLHKQTPSNLKWTLSLTPNGQHRFQNPENKVETVRT